MLGPYIILLIQSTPGRARTTSQLCIHPSVYFFLMVVHNWRKGPLALISRPSLNQVICGGGMASTGQAK